MSDTDATMATALEKAEAGVRRMRATRNDRWYPDVHIAAAAGWINDPNGLSVVDGRYQVYFQHHPYSTEWGPMHWGHVSSDDLVTWRREPIALAPSTTADRDGVFSGSAIVRDDGALAVLYTGHRFRNGVDEDEGNLQVQCLAVSTDGGRTFSKEGTVIDCPEGFVHFRDPKVWKQDGRWFLVVGVSTLDRRGQVWLYTCDDPKLKAWDFDSVLYEAADPNVFMLECPDFFPLSRSGEPAYPGDPDTRWVLVFSPMGATPHGYTNRNGNNAVYVVGDWAPGQPFTDVSPDRPSDSGANYYAPQTFQAPDGRRILFGWMGSFTAPEPTRAEDSWCGQFTVPRELRLSASGDSVLTVPVAEYARLRQDTVASGPVTVGLNEDVVLAGDIRDAAEVELEIDLDRTTAERVSLLVHATPTGNHTAVSWDDQSGRVCLDRRLSGAGDRGYRSVPVPASDGTGDSSTLRLRVIVDRGSVEVFVGDGEGVISSAVFPPEGPRALVLSSESGSAELPTVTVHRLRSIWEDPADH
jgi:beta-fructofuranosidase